MDRTYNDVKDKFVGYWPKAKFTAMEKKLWDQRLRNLNMNDLWEALDEVKASHYASTPQMNWVLKEYHKINSKRASNRLQSIGPSPDEVQELLRDQEALSFRARVDVDLESVSDDEKRRAAASLPIPVDRSPSDWGSVTKGLVWLKLFGGSSSSASPSPSPDLAPPV